VNIPLGMLGRYVINGVVATAVHYSVLFLNIEVFSVRSAAVANVIASIAGIAVSFVGNRYFVFSSTSEPIVYQALKFSGLYALVALLHGSVLLIWTDWLELHYSFGFLLAVCIQMLLGFWASKRYVFNRSTLIQESAG
jgi:putative flippase GtrA